MKALRKALHRPWVACMLISLLVLGAVLGLRAAGWLQRPELITYDLLVDQRSKPDCSDPRIVLVGMTENDLVKYGYPIDDAKLAEVIEKIDAQEPAVIGLDLYRDLPEPRDRSLYPRLEEALLKRERVVAIERVGYFGAPEAMKAAPDRICANNLNKDADVDGVYRRGPLYVTTFEFGPSLPSLSLALAEKYFIANGGSGEWLEKAGEIGGVKADLLRLGKTTFYPRTPDAGGYVGLKVKDYEYLIDYQCPRRFRVNHQRVAGGKDEPMDVSYDYSFGEIIRGEIPPDALRGKIVLMATVMESIKDSNPTPIDDNLRGVHIHAMMVHQLLRAAIDGIAPLKWWPEWAEIAWIAMATLLGGALGLLLRSPWKLAPALALLLGAIAGAGWLAFQNGTWVLIAAPALGCFVSATFVTSFVAYLERSEKGAMQHLFSKHVSPTVVDALWAQRDQFLDGGRLKPQRVTATVLFTDLKGFSTTSEKMDPTTLMDWMNEYMNDIARHVDENGGMINKFIGDAIMAIFGVPVFRTREEEIDLDAIHAVECALAMRRELHQLNFGWAERGLPTTAMRIGIYTGALVAGSMGSADRLEFTVLGDTVNTGARLEAAGKDAPHDERTAECMILIGDSTRQRLGDRFETIEIGAMSLKGKADKIVVHSVIGMRGPRDTAPPAVPAAAPEDPRTLNPEKSTVEIVRKSR